MKALTLARPSSPWVPYPNLPRRLVLVVDDSLAIRALMKRQLLSTGLRIAQAQDGISALAITKWLRPDAVLLDLNLPGISGFDFLLHLSRDKERCRIPVIVVSGIFDEDTKDRARSLGAASFIEKPISFPKLLHALDRALDVSPA